MGALRVLAITAALSFGVLQARAHPHVFVDGGVDFVVDDDGSLTALKVTWLYDAFETLYILSSHEMSLNASGGLDEEDRRRLIQLRSDWPDDFDGSAHLMVDGSPIQMKWPSDLDATVIDGRLQLTFMRQLETEVDLSGTLAEVAFYESTYFFAFSITNTPEVLGSSVDCDMTVRHFEPDESDTELQEALAKLSREETPEIAQVGELFADRIFVQCV